MDALPTACNYGPETAACVSILQSTIHCCCAWCQVVIVALPAPRLRVRHRQMSDQDLLHNPELRQVMVVIGKHLVRDQVRIYTA